MIISSTLSQYRSSWWFLTNVFVSKNSRVQKLLACTFFWTGIRRDHTYSLAELTKALPRLICDVAQAKVWTVGLLLLIIETLIEIFLHVALIWGIFDIPPSNNTNRACCKCLQLIGIDPSQYEWCVEVLYLSTLNLGKWIEFLMKTVKLMASTKAGSLLMIFR